ncbi:hypothetical protein LXT21_04295 [Myxococcus sp. K38C18041901]|uniref:hypothetical protein n=1 Tax=Myxococcus guangdongensis TaxID=2906760 RepID=UPI0020A6F3A0|nr:hypothetical protein [Myxococcus guangdongensis]MCP3057993.1 hypothetical protein [Myxococcus guangdongensis]
MGTSSRVLVALFVAGVVAVHGEARAQTPLAGALTWAHPGTGPSEETGEIAATRDGGFLSFVNFTGSVDVGAVQATAPGGAEERAVALVRHSPQGQPSLLRVINGWHGFHLTVDTSGNIVLLAWPAGPPLGNLFSDDPHLMKFDSVGRLLWLRPIRSSELTAQALVTDRDGNIGIGGYTLTAQGSARLAFVKYDGEGVKQWAFVDVNTVQSVARAATVDSEGHFYVAGDAIGAISSAEPYLIRISASGQAQWRRRLVGALGFAYGVATHGNRVVMVGTYANTFTFAGQPHTSTANLGIDQDAFVAAWTREGEERWAWNFAFDIEGVAMDFNDGVTVIGGYQGGSPDTAALGSPAGNASSAANVYVAKFDRLQGTPRWVKSFPSGQDRSSPGLDAGSVAVTQDGRPAVLGRFHDTLQVGAQTWTASGVSDLFLFGFEP